MPGFATPTRDSIELALNRHTAARQIRSWARGGAPPNPKWRVTLNNRRETEIRTYTEAKLFCAALDSAAQAHADPDNAEAAAGLTRELSTQASELLRDLGRVTASGRAYLVIIPDGYQPPDPVYLRQDDGRILAAHLEARIRPATPEEAGLDDTPAGP